MSYFILMGRRIPKQAITGFKFQNETDNIRPFLSIRIRGKDEIIPFKDKKEIQSVKAHLCSVFSGFVKIGDWYLKMSEVKEYKPVTAEDMNPYILFKTSKFGNIKVRTTTLSKEDVDKIHSYGIKLPTNRLGNEGYFNSIALSDLESQIREVLKRCLSYKIVEEVPVIKYQLETNCTFSYDKNGNIVPNPSKEWTGGDENGEWRDGTSRLDALNAQPFGFSVYAKPFLKRVIEYGNGETKVEYSRLNTEKGTYAHWLNCVTSISYNRYKQVMEVECNECTSKLFVDMIKSICNISEQVKSFINPEQIKAIAGSNEPILLLSNN